MLSDERADVWIILQEPFAEAEERDIPVFVAMHCCITDNYQRHQRHCELRHSFTETCPTMLQSWPKCYQEQVCLRAQELITTHCLRTHFWQQVAGLLAEPSLPASHSTSRGARPRSRDFRCRKAHMGATRQLRQRLRCTIPSAGAGGRAGL